MSQSVAEYIAYYRTATDHKGSSGAWVEAQREAVTQFLIGRGQIVDEFSEVASGMETNRPQLLAALNECRKRKAILIVARLDRLSRNIRFLADLMNSDVEFIAADMPKANRLAPHFLATVAETKREIIPAD